MVFFSKEIGNQSASYLIRIRNEDKFLGFDNWAFVLLFGDNIWKESYTAKD